MSSQCPMCEFQSDDGALFNDHMANHMPVPGILHNIAPANVNLLEDDVKRIFFELLSDPFVKQIISDVLRKLVEEITAAQYVRETPINTAME